MIKILFFVFLILCFSFSVNAFRINSAPVFTDLQNKDQLNSLNDYLQSLQVITNGRYSPNSNSTISTGVGSIKMYNTTNSTNTGFMEFSLTNGTMVYVPYFEK